MGPYRDYPGFDTIGQGMSGLLSLLTSREEPEPMGISLSDHLAGIFASYGILAALAARERTGRGQRVQTSLLESSIAFLAESAANYLEKGGAAPDRETRTREAQVFAFVARDAAPLVIHLSSPQKFWLGLLRATGLEQLEGDPRFGDRTARRTNYGTLRNILAAVFQTRDRDDWLQRLRSYDVPCGPLYDLKETFEDPQVQLLGLRKTLPHPTRKTVTVIGSAVRLSDTPIEITTAARDLGADNDEVFGTITL
jgi:crotonobetainyl-CoA:carnitine CoA-transferase CaiB-like acyl-CoA transferase